MRHLRLVDWPHEDEVLWSEDDMTLRERIEGRLAAWYDGSWPARAWWDVTHPPKVMDWVPPWRRHKPRCSDRLFDAYQQTKVGDGEEFRSQVRTYSYCASCDYWHLTPRNPIFWVVLVLGEH